MIHSDIYIPSCGSLLQALGVVDEVVDHYEKKIPVRKICLWLQSEHDVFISEDAVRSFCRRQKAIRDGQRAAEEISRRVSSGRNGSSSAGGGKA